MSGFKSREGGKVTTFGANRASVSSSSATPSDVITAATNANGCFINVMQLENSSTDNRGILTVLDNAGTPNTVLTWAIETSSIETYFDFFLPAGFALTINNQGGNGNAAADINYTLV